MEKLFRDADSLGRDAFALEVAGGFDRRILGHNEHPAGGVRTGFAVRELHDLADVGGVFLHPIVAGDAAIEVAVLNVAADFLRAEETDAEFGIVHGRTVGAARAGNGVARFREKRDGRLHEASRGKADSENFRFHVSAGL